ncbi:MAG: serine hydrolase, partial [Flavobacteriales bacterium]
QMFLNTGAYGGEHFLSDSVLSDFTRCQFCETGNRRGAGFDKPTPDGSWGPTCNCISLESFGHSGFTGTLAWADPDKRVVYVFLSNRVYPDATNNKLVKLGTRTRIMQVIYDAIEKSENR